MTSLNGIIANTSAAIILYIASLANYTISGTYILMPTLFLLRKREMNKRINRLKTIKVVIGAIFVTLFSMFLSVIMSIIFLYLDYKGPYNQYNNAFYQTDQPIQ